LQAGAGAAGSGGVSAGGVVLIARRHRNGRSGARLQRRRDGG
jgi:hypothetical protein